MRVKENGMKGHEEEVRLTNVVGRSRTRLSGALLVQEKRQKESSKVSNFALDAIMPKQYKLE